MLRRFTSHLRHNVVAHLALFLALGGTAVAAEPLVTGADVEDGSPTGADIGNDSLTGQHVLEEHLGAVPVACGVLRLGPAPGRVPPDAVYGYSFGDNDESGFFGAVSGDESTIEGANLTMSLFVGRDTSLARVEIVKRGCEFTRWIIRSEDGNGL